MVPPLGHWLKMNDMTRYIIEVEIDERKLRDIDPEAGRDIVDDESSVDDLIRQEMGWVRDSGIYIVEITEKINNLNAKP